MTNSSFQQQILRKSNKNRYHGALFWGNNSHLQMGPDDHIMGAALKNHTNERLFQKRAQFFSKKLLVKSRRTHRLHISSPYLNDCLQYGSEAFAGTLECDTFHTDECRFNSISQWSDVWMSELVPNSLNPALYIQVLII